MLFSRVFFALCTLLSRVASAYVLESLSTVSELPIARSLDTRATITSAPAASSTGIYFITTEHIVIEGHTDAHVTLQPHTINIEIPTCIQTATPDKNGYVPPGTCNAFYDYYPSFAAAFVAAILFGIVTIAHIAQAAFYKKAFCWVLIMGAIWETGSFATRTLSTRHQQNAALLIVSQILVLIAPLWINAFDYMVFGRMVNFFIPTHSLFSIPAPILATGFVLLDFFAFVIQLLGGSWAGPTAPPDQQLKGIHIYMGGIGIQQFFILIFLGLAAKFHAQMFEMEGRQVAREGWRKMLYTLYASLGLISIRIMFRLIEFSGGKTSSNPLPTHEAYFYVLEGVPMLLAILIMNISHPGMVFQGPDSKLPGFWRTLRGLRHRKTSYARVDEDAMELVAKRNKVEY